MSQIIDELVADLKQNPPSDLRKILQKMLDNAVKANADDAVVTAIHAEGVLTLDNVHDSTGLYKRFQETTYEQVWKVLREAGLAKQAGPRRPV